MSEVKKLVDEILQPEDVGNGMVMIHYDTFVNFGLLMADKCDIDPVLIRRIELAYDRADTHKKKRIRKKKKNQVVHLIAWLITNLNNPNLKNPTPKEEL